MANYREGGGVVRIADDHVMPIKGIVNLSISFWPGKDWVQVVSPNVAHAPLLGYNLLLSKMMANRGHKYVGEKKGVALHLKNGNTLLGLSVRKLNGLSVFRHQLDLNGFAPAKIAPEKIPSVLPVDINTLYASHGPVDKKLPRSIAKQIKVVLEKTLREYEGCLVAKGLGKPICRTTSTRADKVFDCLLVEIVKKSLLRRLEEIGTCW